MCSQGSRTHTENYILATYSGRGNNGLKVRLNVSAISRASSMCCFWSSPTGTCVALIISETGGKQEVRYALVQQDVSRLQHGVCEETSI